MGGLLGLFPQFYMARIDCFVGIFAEAPKRAGWLFAVWSACVACGHGRDPVAPGHKPKVSRPSRRARLILAAAARKDDIARSRVVVTVGPVPSVGGSSTVAPAGVDDDAVIHGVQELPSPVVRDDKPKIRYDAYLSRKGCNGFIYERLQKASEICCVCPSGVCPYSRSRPCPR